MALSILKDLKRRSKASFRTERSTDSSSVSHGSKSSVPTTKSSSTLNSMYGTQTPPAATLQASSSSSNIFELANGNSPPSRPAISSSSSSKRYSVSGMSGLGSPVINGTPALPPSPFAPRLLNVTEGCWAYSKVLSVNGTVGDLTKKAVDGTVTVSRLDDDFPQVHWPVSESHFKTLVFLSPGPNRLRFDFSSPKLANSQTSNPIHSTYVTVNMVPLSNSPPLQLAILLAKDSPGTFDSTPARIEREGNTLETAIQKFRMAAYLWQAFTAEQMNRNKFGRRAFRFEEEWQSGTSNYRDRFQRIMRNEAKIHIIRSTKTLAEIRGAEYHNSNGSLTDDLLTWAGDELQAYFNPLPGQKQYVSVLVLDSHSDKHTSLIRGHKTSSREDGGEIQISIFGSHALHSYPTCIEDVVPAFTDCTRTDTSFVANDANASGSSWEAANVGLGAQLHEMGYIFGCPRQESGIMMRDYVNLNRSFTTREPFSTRTNEKGGLVLARDECTWHRLDCLRFRDHPCFRTPVDPRIGTDESVQVWPVDNGNVQVTSSTGIAFIELFLEGDDVCHNWVEYGDGNGGGPVQRHITLTEQELRNRLPEERKARKLRIVIYSRGGGNYEVADFGLLTSKASALKLSNGHWAYRGSKAGLSQLEGSVSQELVFESALKQTKAVRSIVVYHDLAIDGLEFVYENSETQLLGTRGSQAGGTEFNLDIRRGETLLGFNVRAGQWIDGVQILTSNGRKSGWFGSASTGSHFSFIPPLGYNIAGVSGSHGLWMDSFALLVTR